MPLSLRGQTDSRAYFGSISPQEAIEIGKRAKSFTADLLHSQFTVLTRWQNALGSSTLQRFYAFVIIGDDDLGEVLVKEGLARIHGTDVDKPKGRTKQEELAYLKQLEAQAKAEGRGAWTKHAGR